MGKFQPGKSGNPAGRPPLPPELRKIKELTSQEVKRIFAKYARMSEYDLNLAASDGEEIAAIDLIIVKGLQRAIQNGDYLRLNFILDRTIGKVKSEESDNEDDAGKSFEMNYKK